MCTAVIVDADVFHRVLPSTKGDGDPVFLSWIRRRDGALVYAETGKFSDELKRNPRTLRLMQEYRSGQRASLIRADELKRAEAMLRRAEIRSNDMHVLQVALVSDALVLCSNDGRLRDDFRDADVLPKVGRRGRTLYPMSADRKSRRAFLGRRRCLSRRG